MRKYDAVVVGAGNSGLTAALRLAVSGKRTLLIEQHNLPGGCATSFRRGRFEFDLSLHELCDLGPEEHPGTIRKMFNKFGVDLGWAEIPDCFRAVYRWSDDGSPMDVTMPTGKQAFIDRMEEYVPGTRRQMEAFFTLAEQTLYGISWMTASGGKPDMGEAGKYIDFLKAGSMSTTEVLKALELPQRARDILGVYWSYLGVDMDHLAWTHYIAMVWKYIVAKPWMPTMTAHEISMALLERFRDLGGEVWMNCRAESFVFEGTRCAGVRTDRGEVRCDYVLANINPHIIYGKMVPPELVPEREKKLASIRKFSGRLLVASFGVSKSAEELGIRDYSIFLSSTADTRAQYEAMRDMDNDFSIMVCPNVVVPEFSPPGTCVVSFTAMYTSEVWADVAPEDYAAAKNKVGKRLIEQLRDLTGIDITDCVEEVSIATPLTFARYLGTPEGCVYGYESSDWDAMMARMMMLGRDYPIKGLRPIGAAGPQGDGYSSTYIVGDLMAKIALRELAEGGDR